MAMPQLGPLKEKQCGGRCELRIIRAGASARLRRRWPLANWLRERAALARTSPEASSRALTKRAAR